MHNLLSEFAGQEHKEIIAEALEVVEVAAGQNVYMQGDTGSRFYIIKEGLVTCTKTTDPTKPPALFTLNAGQFFGERALLKDEVRQVLRPGCIMSSQMMGGAAVCPAAFPCILTGFLTLLQVCCKPCGTHN